MSVIGLPEVMQQRNTGTGVVERELKGQQCVVPCCTIMVHVSWHDACVSHVVVWQVFPLQQAHAAQGLHNENDVQLFS